jgi:hypothetical protein
MGLSSRARKRFFEGTKPNRFFFKYYCYDVCWRLIFKLILLLCPFPIYFFLFCSKRLPVINGLGQWSKDTIGKLYFEGTDFLMGMLFRECFIVSNAILANLPSKILPVSNNTFSLALHSRHTITGDTGEFISEELNCLQQLLPIKPSPSKCFVYLMSDRVLTIQLLSTWLIERNCTPLCFDSSTSGISVSTVTTTSTLPVPQSRLRATEHGKRAGTGFIIDLLSASRARDAYIGDMHRSSFMLLLELIAYDRKIEAWKHGTMESLKSLNHCKIKNRSPSGYNYGPGTPTFRHHSILEPLSPIASLDEYKRLHSVTALQNNTHERMYAIATLIPISNASSFVYHFLNSKFFVVV